MPYIHLLADPGMNYTLNRPLLDGTSPARLKEIGAVAPEIKDYKSWHTVWLGLAKRAEREQRWLDAASYYHGAEFYLPAGDARNSLYDDFARTWSLGMKGVVGYERIAVPYPGGHLPGFRIQAKGKEIGTFIFHGGYDSSSKSSTPFCFPSPISDSTSSDSMAQDKAERCGKQSISSTPGKNQPRRCSTTSSWRPSAGWELPVAAICRSALRRSSLESSTSSPYPRRTRAST